MDEKHAEMTKKAKTTATISPLADEKKEKPSPPLLSLQLLKEYGELMRFNQGERLNERRSTPSSSSGSQVLSTNDIMKVARARLLQCTSQNLDVVSILINSSFDANSGMPSETYEDLELALLLHASALKIYNRQFDRARKLLTMCGQYSSVSGNPVQKIVFYLAEALEKRITRELGTVPSENPEGNQTNQMAVEEALTTFQPATVHLEQDVPFCRICEYTAIQCILENVASAKRVHLIDLGIRSGSHWSVLMQGLQALADHSECPLEMLKLTAIGTSKEIIETIGKHLSSFAETMKIPFQFNVLVSDLQNLKEDMFEIEADEALAIHSELRLSSLLAWPDRLESLVQTIANLHPCVMVSTELEANTNASDFMDRFNETVSLASAVFDCLEDSIDRDNPCRAIIEEVFIREMIQNIIAAEGEERVHRQQSIGMWRVIMARCGLVELPPSNYALNQANMLVKNNPRWSNCTLDSDGKCLIVGWRGNPIKSVSVWKFQHD